MDLFAPGNISTLTWMNDPERWNSLPGGRLRVAAKARTDFFRNPDGQPASNSGHLFWTPVEGDFVAQIHVRPAFRSTYDAGALMVHHDETHWAKICFENTDFHTHAVVSVVTNGVSDDANGVDLDVAHVWLQVVRRGNVFALHYALDGQDWHMVRYFGLPTPPRVKVGLVAQSPVGPGTTIDYLQFTIESRSVEDLRAGV